jgi:hypothetical protein
LGETGTNGCPDITSSDSKFPLAEIHLGAIEANDRKDEPHGYGVREAKVRQVEQPELNRFYENELFFAVSAAKEPPHI